jgi:hypothetical protein
MKSRGGFWKDLDSETELEITKSGRKKLVHRTRAYRNARRDSSRKWS